jgi:hypothetical protein
MTWRYSYFLLNINVKLIYTDKTYPLNYKDIVKKKNNKNIFFEEAKLQRYCIEKIFVVV